MKFLIHKANQIKEFIEEYLNLKFLMKIKILKDKN